jgi:hypothetical protein
MPANLTKPISFVVVGPAATKGSVVAIATKTGAIVKPDHRGLGVWSQACGWAARLAKLPCAPRGIGVHVEAVYEFVPPLKKRRSPCVRPDVDKLARALLDSLIGIAFIDDQQVVSLLVRKVYGSAPLTTITITREVS